MVEPKDIDEKKSDPSLKDVEPGSDADEMPPPEAGKTPKDPNEKQ